MESKCDGGWWTTEQKALTSKTVLFRVTEVSSRTTNLKKSMTNNVCLLFVVFVVAYLSSLTGLIIREIWQIFYFVLWIYPAVRCTPKKMIIITFCPITKKNVLHAYIHVSSSVSSLRLLLQTNDTISAPSDSFSPPLPPKEDVTENRAYFYHVNELWVCRIKHETSTVMLIFVWVFGNQQWPRNYVSSLFHKHIIEQFSIGCQK